MIASNDVSKMMGRPSLPQTFAASGGVGGAAMMRMYNGCGVSSPTATEELPYGVRMTVGNGNGCQAPSNGGLSGTGSGPSSVIGSMVSSSGRKPVTGGANVSLGYLLMKFQEILKSSDKPLHIHELAMHVGQDAKAINMPEFQEMLKESPRIHFDATTKRWSYRSPFEGIKNQASLKLELRERTEYANGLEVTQELLNYHPEMEDWINNLLRNRELRAIRATRNVKCKNYTAESGIQCDLYEKDKCDACNSLKGLVLYALEGEHVENVAVDPDIKALWNDIPMPNLDTMLTESNSGRKRLAAELRCIPKKRARSSRGGKGARVCKILNTHIYTVEDFREEVNRQDGW